MSNDASDPFAELRAAVMAYDFREVQPSVRFGTASDRYAGWIGQIYLESYTDAVKTRKKRLGSQSFEERTVPIASVADYFQHFGVLELDFTFYRPLREADGEDANTLHVLRQYAQYAPPDALFLLKAPSTFFARTLRRGRKPNVTYAPNPDFLDAEGYTRRFLEPALEVLGERLIGVIFEQAYMRVQDSPAPDQNVAHLDAFFRAIPNAVQPHIELRSPHLLEPVYFDWLASAGIGHVFSHWTWLPPIREQWAKSGQRLTAADGNIVARLLTPLRLPYEKAYAQAYPFDKPLESITSSAWARNMVLDAVALTYKADLAGHVLNLIANNRAWGNAPHLAQTIALRILDEEARRMG
ncbi:MAG: DUF72 domain-containing protein [Bacteroidota bacterium]